MRKMKLSLSFLLLHVLVARAFVIPVPEHHLSLYLSLSSRNSPSDEAETAKKLLQLPDSSSFSSSEPASNLVNDKFEIQFTCKVCETRNQHSVSRIAYRQGVVICICKKCLNKHWIADNLGWADYMGGFEGTVSNIEEYFKKNDNDGVHRVSSDVFELESLLEWKSEPNKNAD
mmetsp:Transcript_6708/g.9815  ORF Transcript_6708/g.9815 Transcript_6708/m.9815 type:complete len:173 (-) Transcript_6708:249-767(-)